MESNDRRQRQSNPAGYAGQLHTSQQFTNPNAQDRFRSALTAQSPTSAPSAARASSGQGYSYGYGDGTQLLGSSMHASGLQYQGDYTPDVQRPQQQQYSQYGTGSMYNVTPQQQAAPQSPYEAVQPYQAQARQSVAAEVLAGQFGVPHSYESGQFGTNPAALASQPTYGISYTPQSTTAQSQLAPAYTPIMDPITGPAHGGYGQTTYNAPTAIDFDNHYNEYQTRLRMTFEYVHNGQLSKAGDSLMELTTWLLTNAETLVRDDEATYADKIKLWDDFNTCWLTTLQRQKEMTQSMLETGHRPPSPQSLIEYDFMEGMGKDLVRLCDQMEKYGLVDYQMGVREEEIVTHLIRCLDLLEEAGSHVHPGPSSAGGLHR